MSSVLAASNRAHRSGCNLIQDKQNVVCSRQDPAAAKWYFAPRNENGGWVHIPANTQMKASLRGLSARKIVPAATHQHRLSHTGCHTPATTHRLPHTGCHTPAATHRLPHTGCHTPATTHRLPHTGYHTPATTNTCKCCPLNLIQCRTTRLCRHAHKMSAVSTTCELLDGVQQCRRISRRGEQKRLAAHCRLEV
jgi:hypothetical protein